MTATATIASPCPKSNHLTRRAALRGTAALGAAAVLPAGAAIAAAELPTGADPFWAVLAEYDAAGAASSYDKLDEHPELEDRWTRATEAMINVRPTEPRAVVRHFRWYVEELRGGSDLYGPVPFLDYIATQLEQLVGRAAA